MRWMALIVALLAASPAFARDRAMGPEERYELCLKFMKRGYFTKALEQCNRVRNYHRDDPVSVLAELAIADIYFKRGDFEQARMAYSDFSRLHPRHESLDYVTWREGFAIYKRAPKLAGRDQTPTRQAVNVWTGFDTRFPDSSWTDDVDRLHGRARNRLAAKELHIARFYARKHAWGAVRKRAQGVVERYSDSVHVPIALALMVEAHHAWGETEAAKQVRERLAADYPGTAQLAYADRVLGRPAGEKPEEDVFVRPYRYPGMGQMGQQGGP